MSTSSMWQSVMLVLNERLECDECGALALFIMLDDAEGNGDERVRSYSAWCRDCFFKDTVEEVKE